MLENAFLAAIVVQIVYTILTTVSATTLLCRHLLTVKLVNSLKITWRGHRLDASEFNQAASTNTNKESSIIIIDTRHSAPLLTS